MSSVSPQTHTELEQQMEVINELRIKILLCFFKISTDRYDISKCDISPLESKWHSMGAADALLVHRRNPVTVSAQLTPASSIFFLWSGQRLVPLLPLQPQFIHPEASQPRRGGVVSTVTGLAGGRRGCQGCHWE